MMQVDAGEAGGVNDPRAKWMAVIAFINQNIAIAGIFGSFSVLLTAVEARLHVDRQLSTLAVPALTLAAALCGPFVGVLATRLSMKTVMLAGSIFGVAGFLLLALTASFPLYILAFGLLLGPSMSIGTVLSPALVTRWFVVNRGKALGFVCAPIVIAVVPLATTWALQRYGISTTYLCLAALGTLSVIANLFIIDWPAGAPASAAAPGAVADPKPAGSSIASLLSAPRFWARTFAYSASAGLTVMLTAHIVPMGKSWGFSPEQAATLLSIQCVAGIVGTIVMGWVADRIGGVRALMVLMAIDALAFALLSAHLGFAATAILCFVFGTQSAGSIPVFGMALSEGFGRAEFARNFGIANLINLPFAVAGAPVAAIVYDRTGSYTDAFLGGAVIFVLVLLFIFVTRRERPVRA